MDSQHEEDQNSEDVNAFLVSFGVEGLELLENLTSHIEEGMIERLSNSDGSCPEYNKRCTFLFQAFELRCRLNAHRKIETYILTVSDEISLDEIDNAFQNYPDYMKELVRNKGEVVKSCTYV